MNIILEKFLTMMVCVCSLFLGISNAWANAPTEEWVARYNDSANAYDSAVAMVVDKDGNVYVTGLSDSDGNSSYDYATVKYDSGGNQLWVARYNGPGNGYDIPTAIAVDDAGNVYVTGGSDPDGSYNYDYATVKYDSSGNQLWVARYNGPGIGFDQAVALAVDSFGNIYVTGSSFGSGGDYDYATVKYDSSGTQLWVARYNGPGYSADLATALVIDGSGNIYVTGQSVGSSSYYNYATIKYNSNGDQIWVARYNGPGNGYDIPTAIAVDVAGNVYVTGSSDPDGSYNYDYATVKYDNKGNELWVARYNGLGSKDDRAHALAVDDAGDVYVTGISDSGIGSTYNNDYVTIKYDTNGNQVWLARYDDPKHMWDIPIDIALNDAGDVYVTGNAEGYQVGAWATGYDYLTVKYDNQGNQMWAARYYGTGGTNDNTASAVATDSAGNVYVTGADYDFVTIKYNDNAVNDTIPPIITAPANITAEATSVAGAAVTYPPCTATDNIDPVPVISYSIDSGTVFPLGTTNVQCVATDSSGNSSSASFNVTVQDTTPPTITAPPAMDVEATSSGGAVVAYPPCTAADSLGSSPTITYNPPSGSTFPVGTTTVSCTATDSAGNTSTSSFTVTVADSKGPTFVKLPDVTVAATSDTGAIVNYPLPQIQDAVDPSPTINYNPVSGTFFPIGKTLVTVTATDFSGNTSVGTFNVIVLASGSAVLSLPRGSTIDFSEHHLNTTSSPEAVLIINTGAVDLVIGALTTQSLDNNGSYQIPQEIDGCSNTTLLPGGQCWVYVTYSPTALVSSQGQVVIPSNAASSPDIISLSGTGVQDQQAAVPNMPDVTAQNSSSQPPPTSTRGLIVIVHGWNSNADGWPADMKKAIENQLQAENITDKWSVITYDWRYIGTPICFLTLCESFTEESPIDAYNRAFSRGLELGKLIDNNNYSFIHFIGHSAGSNVIDVAAHYLKKQSSHPPQFIHMTFLDAYAPFNAYMTYGQDADWAEQYVDKDFSNITNKVLLHDTDHDLTNAINFDVTYLYPYYPQGALDAHQWPYKWYSCTAGNLEQLGCPKADAFGYTVSQEAKGLPPEPPYSTPNHFPIINSGIYYPYGSPACDLASSSILKLEDCAKIVGASKSTTTLKAMGPTFDFSTLLTNPWVVFSSTGTVTVPWIYAADLKPGSPAWFSMPITISDSINSIKFRYQFLTDSGQDGGNILRVFVDDQNVFRIDEPFADSGVNTTPDIPIGNLSPGPHTITFRVDPTTTTKNTVEISDFQTGLISLVSDTTPPVVTAPADISVLATSTAGAVVNYSPCTAVDDIDPTPSISYSQLSGTTFPIGTTTVQCMASDGAGNIDTASFTVIVTEPTPPDLVIDNLVVTPSPAAVGQNVTVTAIVTNNGTEAANSFAVDIYKNLPRPPTVDQVGDFSCTVSNLAGGASTQCMGTVSYASIGTDILWAQVDSHNTVVEANETNNTNHTGLAVRKPDLRVTILSVPTSDVVVGQTVTLSATVTNASPVDAILPFEVDVYQNLTSAPMLGQVGNIQCPVSRLAAQATITCSGTVNYTAAGVYNVWAQADATGALDEADETNNVAGPSTLTMINTYDLTLNQIGTGTGSVSGAGTYNDGTTVVVTATAGTGSSFAGWNGPDAADCATGKVVMNANKSCTATFTLNTYTLSLTTTGTGTGTVTGGGSYDYGSTATVTASADTGSSFAGWSGSDGAECTTGSVAMTGNKTCTATFNIATSSTTPPELSVTLAADHTKAAVGEPVQLTATVTNSGGSPATNFQVDLYQSGTSPSVGQTGDFSCPIASLDAGQSTTCVATFTYSNTGTSVAWAQADTLNVVSEPTETNNMAHVGLSVGYADLYLTSVSSTAWSGTGPLTVTITATVKNASGYDVYTPFSIDLYQNQSTAPVPGQAGDVSSTTPCVIPSMIPNEMVTCTETVTYTTPGTYTIWGQADTYNTVDETKEQTSTSLSNNIKMGSRNITVH